VEIKTGPKTRAGQRVGQRLSGISKRDPVQQPDNLLQQFEDMLECYQKLNEHKNLLPFLKMVGRLPVNPTPRMPV
jgi:hypothetical protein